MLHRHTFPLAFNSIDLNLCWCSSHILICIWYVLYGKSSCYRSPFFNFNIPLVFFFLFLIICWCAFFRPLKSSRARIAFTLRLPHLQGSLPYCVSAKCVGVSITTVQQVSVSAIILCKNLTDLDVVVSSSCCLRFCIICLKKMNKNKNRHLNNQKEINKRPSLHMKSRCTILKDNKFFAASAGVSINAATVWYVGSWI